MLSSGNTIFTISQLKREIDRFWAGIEKSCEICTDPDCVGYVWIMPEEEDALLDAGGQTVQVNGDNGLIFIDSYPRDSKGNLIVGISKPRCPYLDSNKKCSVHSVRPLTCHLYPLGIETQLDGRIVWALHTDCAHVRTMKESGYQELLLCNLKQLLQRISSSLKEEIRIVYEKTDSIAVFPNGSNNYLVLEEI